MKTEISSSQIPLIFGLDNIRSAHNVGSAFRIADAFGLQALFLGGITPTPPHPSLDKTALGAEKCIHWKKKAHLSLFFPLLKKEGYQIWVVEQVKNALPLTEWRPKRGKYCLIFGNEITGISRNLIENADGAVEIIQFGKKKSLNVSVAMGIVAWSYRLKRET